MLPDPLLGIHAAVNHPNPEQRVSPAEALRMMTLDAAYAAFYASSQPGVLRAFLGLQNCSRCRSLSRVSTLHRLTTIFRLDAEFRCGLWRAYLELDTNHGHYQDTVEMLGALDSNEPGVAREALGFDRGRIAGPLRAEEHRALRYLSLCDMTTETTSSFRFISRARTPRKIADELCRRACQPTAPLQTSVGFRDDRELIYGSFEVRTRSELRWVLGELSRWSVQFDLDWEVRFRARDGYLGPATSATRLANELCTGTLLPEGELPLAVPERPLAALGEAPVPAALILDEKLQGLRDGCGGNSLVDIRAVEGSWTNETGPVADEILRQWSHIRSREKVSAEIALKLMRHYIDIPQSYIVKEGYVVVADEQDEALAWASEFIGAFGDDAAFWKVGPFEFPTSCGGGTIVAVGGGCAGFMSVAHTD